MQLIIGGAGASIGAPNKGVRSYLLTGFIECGVHGSDGKPCGAKLVGGRPGGRIWPAADSPLLERAKALGGPWCFDPSKIDIKWKL